MFKNKEQIFLFIITILISSFITFIISLAWIDPTSNPPLGGGVLQTDTQGLKIITTTRIISGNLLINTGNLGIGVLPTEKLTISGNIALNSGTSSFIGTIDNYDLILRTNNTDRISIKNDGNFNIFSTTTVRNILPETNNTYTLGNQTNQFANIYTNTTTISSNIIIGSNSFHNLHSTTTFFTGTNNNQLVLGLNGNVGIGTINPRNNPPNGINLGNIDVNDVYLRSKGQWVSNLLTSLNLRVFDTGWFYIQSSNTYTFNHNLGTTKIIPVLYLSQNSDGSNAWVAGLFDPTSLGHHRWVDIRNVTTNTISVYAGSAGWYYIISGGIDCCIYSGYARLILLALE